MDLMSYCCQLMKKITLTLIILVQLTSNISADMEFDGFVMSDDKLHGIGRYCIDGTVYITNLVKDEKTGHFIPIGSPVPVMWQDFSKSRLREC